MFRTRDPIIRAGGETSSLTVRGNCNRRETFKRRWNAKMETAKYCEIITEQKKKSVRFEVFTAVTMKNGVFWDVTPCGSCKNRVSEERSA
jgi:hypothetical protein